MITNERHFMTSQSLNFRQYAEIGKHKSYPLRNFANDPK